MWRGRMTRGDTWGSWVDELTPGLSSAPFSFFFLGMISKGWVGGEDENSSLSSALASLTASSASFFPFPVAAAERVA